MLSKKDENALADIDDRINNIERRLRNAKAARDSYIDFLRGKYPSWRPTLTSFNYEKNNQEFIVNRLVTSDYQWDTDQVNRNIPKLPKSFLNFDIPMSGPLLESDIQNTRRRLMEISRQLKNLRGTRLNMSTQEYLKMSPFLSNNRESIHLSSIENESINRLDNVRQRLSQIEFIKTSPIQTPTEEKIEEILRKEEKEKFMENIRNGKMPILWNISSQANVEQIQNIPEPSEIKIQPNVRFSDEQPIEKGEISLPVIQNDTKPVIEAEKPKDEAYSNMMNLLKSKNVESDDDDSPKLETVQKPQGISLLSQYLNQENSESSEDEQVLNKKPSFEIKPSLSKSFANNDDSDDDFFN